MKRLFYYTLRIYSIACFFHLSVYTQTAIAIVTTPDSVIIGTDSKTVLGLHCKIFQAERNSRMFFTTAGAISVDSVYDLNITLNSRIDSNTGINAAVDIVRKVGHQTIIPLLQITYDKSPDTIRKLIKDSDGRFLGVGFVHVTDSALHTYIVHVTFQEINNTLQVGMTGENIKPDTIAFMGEDGVLEKALGINPLDIANPAKSINLWLNFAKNKRRNSVSSPFNILCVTKQLAYWLHNEPPCDPVIQTYSKWK